MGVTWLSSLYWNQVGEYALSITMVSSVGLTTVMSFTFCGNPLPSPQSWGTASSMFSQNFTSDAVTFVPLKVGGLARLSELFTVGWAPLPNQCSGRYISQSRSKMLVLLA